jgi:hypothetical protein
MSKQGVGVPRTEHVGDRPNWDCRVCGGAWPCATAKVELVEEFGMPSSSLAFFLGSCLLEAIDDWAAGSGGPPVDLYERFLGWCTP